MIKNRKSKIALICGLGAIYFLGFLSLSDFSDTAELSRDTWSYQSIAVNFALGNGFHTTGKTADITKYKFKDDYNQRYLNKFNTFGGFVDLHRNLGYPLFLSIIYKTCGIHPIAVKYIQLFLLVLVVAFLPYIGECYWSRSGFISGLVAGPVFLFSNYQIARIIMSESLVTFGIIAVVLSVIYHEKRESFFSAVLLGVVFGISLLIKGSLILVLPIYLLCSILKGNREYKKMVVIAIVAILTIMPWSVFLTISQKAVKSKLILIKELALNQELSIEEKQLKAEKILPKAGLGILPNRNFSDSELVALKNRVLPNVRRNGFILKDTILTEFDKMSLLEQSLSIPSFALLRFLLPAKGFLDTHNELMVKGEWRPEWRTDTTSFYYNDGTGNASAVLRIANYYFHYPTRIIKNAVYKFKDGFGEFSFFWIIVFLFILEAGGSLLSGVLKGRRLFLYYLLFLPIVILPFGFLSINMFFMMPLAGLSVVVYLWKYGEHFKITFPLIMVSLFFNFLLITFLAMGVHRWIQVIDFLFILMAIYYLITYVKHHLLNQFHEGDC